MRLLAAALLLSFSIAGNASEVAFPGSTVTLKIDKAPATHKIDQLGRVVVVPAPGVAYQLKLGPTGTRPAGAPPFDAKGFVEELAKRNKRDLLEVPGTNYTAFVEYTKVQIRDGYRVHEVFGVQAMRAHYIMFTALVSEEFVAAEQVRQHLGERLWAVLAAASE
ncbi:hypothetical protein [Paucibacter sp. Y2R2-4]|uniref:hypothetical protein n=1 Tax=Paucibacter sp. Y2R2-4 TaxID=2893553 RepID=UPI0021E3DB6A|nr:hypothetical protein [Paucibacter sp. Y2R2-4]MCV2350821.1 hypothetical protein [Paucibacter sp. Y2R2-4]